ncbi:MAG: DNA repair protein RecO [Clostridia bacterium]|nr:DNA repair protein RecO [Clostridia bacterium]
MDCIKTRAIVARRANYADSNCILTLFAEGMGAVSASVYGVNGKKSRMKTASQPLCFAEFVLEKGRGGIYTAKSADIIETFYPISEDLTKLALANYFMDIAGDIFSQESNEPLSLLLNTLYALSYKNLDIDVAKAVFELKMMQYAGYEPALSACIKCGGSGGITAFSFAGGAVCTECKTPFLAELSKDVLEAMRYILKSDTKHIFSFEISEKAKDSLSKICEGYILDKSDRRYKSLEYYKKLI